MDRRNRQTERETRQRAKERETYFNFEKKKTDTKQTNKKEIQNVTNKSALFSHASIRTTRTRTKMSLIPRGFWNPFVGEQRAGAAGPLSGACVDDNPLSAFLFSYLSFFYRVFFPKLLWFSLSARAIERIKRNTFRTTEKKIDEKSVFCRISRFVDAIIIRDRFCR